MPVHSCKWVPTNDQQEVDQMGPWRRRGACGETALLIGWALGLLVLPRCSSVIVTSVRPDRGSLAGGTRLHIQVPEPRCSHSLCPVAGRSCACMHVPVARAHAMCVCARGMWCYACVSVRAVVVLWSLSGRWRSSACACACAARAHLRAGVRAL